MNPHVGILLAIVILSPTAFVAPAHSQTAAERQRCQAMQREWQRRVDQYNTDCANVPAGSAQARACAARKAQIEAARPNC